MEQFKLNDKEFQCPESWEEITLEQLLKINTGPNSTLEAVSICTGIPQEEWSKSTDLALMDQVEQTLAFLSVVPDIKLESEPKEIEFNQVKVSPFSDIGKLSIGQYQDLRLCIAEFMEEHGNEIDTTVRLSLYPKIVAIYLQPVIDKGEYDYEKAEYYSHMLYKHSAMEVSAWGYFFILRFQELRAGILNGAPRYHMTPRKQKRGLLNFLKTLDFRRFFTT